MLGICLSPSCSIWWKTKSNSPDRFLCVNILSHPEGAMRWTMAPASPWSNACLPYCPLGKLPRCYEKVSQGGRYNKRMKKDFILREPCVIALLENCPQCYFDFSDDSLLRRMENYLLIKKHLSELLNNLVSHLSLSGTCIGANELKVRKCCKGGAITSK